MLTKKWLIIIESVDSICRDSADTQYMLLQKKIHKISKTANLQAVITPYRSSSSVFMTNNIPSGTKKHQRKYRTRKSPKSSSSSSSDRLVQICVTLSRWFLHKTAALSSAPAHRFFSMFEVTQGDSNCSQKNYGFLCDAIFSSCVCMRTNHLATKCNYYARLLN